MAPPIINKDYYYVLKNRILSFNKRYEEKLMFKGDHRITEDMFDVLSESWKTIAQEHSKSLDIKDVPVDEEISEPLFEQFLQGAQTMVDGLTGLAFNKGLGEVYVELEKEHYDYTHLSHEIFEIAMLAMYTYTSFFQQCRHIKNYGRESETGIRRAKKMAETLFPKDWHIFETPYKSQLLLDNPLMPFQFEVDKGVYRDEKTYQLHTDPKERKPYEKIHEKNLKAQAERIDRLDQERQQKKIDKENAIKQHFIDDEKRRIISEKRHNPQIGDYSVYGTFRDVLQKSRNYEEPGANFEHFYAIFKQKLDIPEDVLNAQTLLDAMHEIKYNGVFNEPFVDQIMPVYHQLQCAAFESAAKRCVEQNIPIDFNDVSRKVDEVMAALYCASEPLKFQSSDEDARILAAEIMNGKLSNRVAPQFNEWLRLGAINQVKEDYRAIGNDAFNRNAEAIYNSYTEYSLSSSRIAKNARHDAVGYTEYREAIESGKMKDDAFSQAIVRSSFMDKAYALEKRIETRYATRWSRFIRMVSYRRQLNALADMKEALGIAPDRRVADAYLEDRLENVVKDFSNIKEIDTGRKMFTKSRDKKESVTEHIRDMMKNAMNGKELPHIEDYTEEIIKRELDGVNDDTVNGRMRKQELEEQERKRQEEEERKRLEKEEEERRKEEERLKRVEEEKEREKQREIEERVRKEKEELYNQKVDEKQLKIEKLMVELKNLTLVDEKRWAEYKEKSDEYGKEIQKMVDLEEQHNYNVSLLKQYEKDAEVLTEKLNEEIQKLVNQAVPEKKMEDVKKKAEKNAEKHIAGGNALKGAEKISKNIEDATRSMTQELNELNLKIDNQRNLIKRYNEKKLEFVRKQDEYNKKINVHSDDWREANTALNNAKKELEHMQQNKEKIIETGEGLGFDLEAFLGGDDFRGRPSVFVSINNNDNDKLRFTVVRDSDVSEPDDLEVEPPVDEGRPAINNKMVK